MPPDADPRIRYLSEILALDPGAQAVRIIELRRDFRGGAVASARPDRSNRDKPSPSGPGTLSPRERGNRVLGKLRDGFWEQGSASVQAELTALELEELPDLARFRDRLLEANDLRDELDDFDADCASNSAFANALRSILIAPEREAAEIRRHFIRSRTRGKLMGANKASIWTLKNSYPALYGLESGWLQKITRAKSDRRDSRALRGGIGFFGIYILYKALVNIARWLSDNWGAN